MSAADDLAQVIAFRNDLVEYMTYVTGELGSRYDPPSAAAQRRIAEWRGRLTREYARLYGPILGAATVSQMRSPMFGTVSQDVVRDAISQPDFPAYGELANMAVSHMDLVIGLLQASVEQSRSVPDPNRAYRLTSPLFWVRQLLSVIVRALRWVVATRNRIIGAVVALVGIIVGAVVSGVAQAIATKLLGT